MVTPVSPLEGHLAPGRSGLVTGAGPGIRLSERRIASLWQVAAWPGRLSQAGAAAAAAAGAPEAPGPGRSAAGDTATLMRIEPLKWWLVAGDDLDRPALDGQDGTVLDLSHARTVIRVEGPETAALMARLVPLDLRARSFPEGAVASTGLHHSGVTLTRREGGIEIFALRSYALSIWEHLAESAAQFGLETA
jgi:heterotetrameric sarcosine oxidase gamma subunit